MNTTIAKSRFEKSADTLIVENILREASEEQIVTYAELTTALGRDVRLFCISNLRGALKACERDGFCFDCVSKIGYKRLTGPGVVKSTVGFVSRSRRMSKRAMNRLSTVEFQELDDESKQKHLTYSAQLGAIHMFSSPKSAKKIESKVASDGQLAIGNTLKLFTDGESG